MRRRHAGELRRSPGQSGTIGGFRTRLGFGPVLRRRQGADARGIDDGPRADLQPVVKKGCPVCLECVFSAFFLRSSGGLRVFSVTG